jgi:hypothetical protein
METTLAAPRSQIKIDPPSASEEINSLFPMEVEVTQKMIDQSLKYNPNAKPEDHHDWELTRFCLGARVLFKGLYEHSATPLFNGDIYWGSQSTTLISKDGELVPITTKEGVDFTKITEPCIVTFKLLEV